MSAHPVWPQSQAQGALRTTAPAVGTHKSVGVMKLQGRGVQEQEPKISLEYLVDTCMSLCHVNLQGEVALRFKGTIFAK